MLLSSSNLTTQELVTSHGEGVNTISGRPAGNRLCSLIYANFRSLVTGSELVHSLIKIFLLWQNTVCQLKEFRSRKKKMKEANLIHCRVTIWLGELMIMQSFELGAFLTKKKIQKISLLLVERRNLSGCIHAMLT